MYLLKLGEAAGFVRSDDPTLFPPSEFTEQKAPGDNTTGSGAPDIEIASTPVAYKEHGMDPPPCLGGDAFALHTVLLRYLIWLSNHALHNYFLPSSDQKATVHFASVQATQRTRRCWTPSM